MNSFFKTEKMLIHVTPQKRRDAASQVDLRQREGDQAGRTMRRQDGTSRALRRKRKPRVLRQTLRNNVCRLSRVTVHCDVCMCVCT